MSLCARVHQGTAKDRRQQSARLAEETAAARAEAERRVATLRALVENLRAEVFFSPAALRVCCFEPRVGLSCCGTRVGSCRQCIPSGGSCFPQVASCKGTIAQLQARVDARGEDALAGDDPLLLRTPGRGVGDGSTKSAAGATGSRRSVALPLLAPVTPMVVTEGARGAAS